MSTVYGRPITSNYAETQFSSRPVEDAQAYIAALLDEAYENVLVITVDDLLPAAGII
jgi:hypothetical protein